MTVLIVSDIHANQVALEAVLERGSVYPLLPPNDIHRIESVDGVPSYSLHVLGADLGRQHRNIFDVETGEVTAVEGRGM